MPFLLLHSTFEIVAANKSLGPIFLQSNIMPLVWFELFLMESLGKLSIAVSFSSFLFCYIFASNLLVGGDYFSLYGTDSCGNYNTNAINTIVTSHSQPRMRALINTKCFYTHVVKVIIFAIVHSCLLFAFQGTNMSFLLLRSWKDVLNYACLFHEPRRQGQNVHCFIYSCNNIIGSTTHIEVYAGGEVL